MDCSKTIFGNTISEADYKKAVAQKKKMIKKFGDDTKKEYHLTAVENKALYPFLGIKNLETTKGKSGFSDEKGLIVGNIRMGFGHYRISMAIASAANSMGYTPYWLDLHSYKETTGGKVIAHLNKLYSMGSRLSQKYGAFNRLYWEPLNSEGFKKLSYNAADQKVAELMTPIFRDIPKDMPYVATHVWPAQAAVHAGVERVVNVIPDNWPMALHLAEGSIHTTQSFSSYLGYKTLKKMQGNKVLKPIPSEDIHYVGHYIDHELVVNLEADTKKRLERIKEGKTKRLLLTVGGAGAQKEIFVKLIKKLLPQIKKGKVALFINVGDHKNVWEELCAEIKPLQKIAKQHFNAWDEVQELSQQGIDGEIKGVHAFYSPDIFEAVYSTNLLMRISDIMITKPSELAFYPVPKLMIQRVGGHEAYGALRAAEIGDGTLECETTGLALQMLDQMLQEDVILEMMNENILKAHHNGEYNGAYKAVELAVTK